MPHVENERAPFSMVPEALVYDTRLSDKAVRVYCCLLRHGDDPSDCYPSHARIADKIGCEKRSVQRPLRELESAGWIERVRRENPDGSRTSDGYFVRRSAQENAPTAHTSAVPPRTDARRHRAETSTERDPYEREPCERDVVVTRVQHTTPSERRDQVDDDGNRLDLTLKMIVAAVLRRRIEERPDLPVHDRTAWEREALDREREVYASRAAVYLADDPTLEPARLAAMLAPDLSPWMPTESAA